MLWSGLVFAQTNQPSATTYPANRYLLVVETSHSMQSRSDGLIREVQNLLGSALAGQARRGDSLGIWTFNEQLYTGLLPAQEWTPENKQAVIGRFTQFLRAQKFEKRGRFDYVLPPLLHLVKRSPFLTVVLVCSGDDEVHGTPFDQRINNFFQTWRPQQLDARVPFVIALRAQGGALVDCSMNPAPWPVELPALPKELFVATVLPPPPATNAAPKPAAPVVPPLIIIGKKHETAAVLTNETPAENKNRATTSAATTNRTGEPPPVAQTTNLQPPAPGTAPASLAQAGNTPGPTPQPTVNEPPPSTPTKAADTTSQETPVQLAAAPGPPSQPSVSEVPAAIASRKSPVPVSEASATPTRSRSEVWILGLTGLGLLGAVLCAFLLWRRRARTPAEVSLITESIDRRKR